MSLKKVSITKTSTYTIEGEGIVDRERILELSKDWSDNHITLFKKLAKQGGVCRIMGVKFTIKVGERITTSKGFKDGGVPLMYGPEN